MLDFELFSLKMTLQLEGAKNIQSRKIHIVFCLSREVSQQNAVKDLKRFFTRLEERGKGR